MLESRSRLEFQTAFATIEAIDAARDQKEVLGLLAGSLIRYGLTAFVVSGLPDPTEAAQPNIILNGWPPEWYERYVQEGFYQDDPCARHCLTTPHPFAWTDIPKQRLKSARARRIVNEAAEFRLTDGFCVPIHSSRGTGGISAAGSEIDLSPSARHTIHLVSVYAYAAAERRGSASEKHVRCLSDRERQVLTCFAMGNTIEDVSEELALSGHTVIQYLRNVRLKLATRNTAHSVAEAIRRREIF
jgi:LuxR family transcriptional regulator, quorum-sensing system regulator BjaR1